MKKYKRRQAFPWTALLVTIGLSVAGCGKVTPPPMDEEQDEFIACQIPEMNLNTTPTNTMSTSPIIMKKNLTSGTGTLSKLTILSVNDTHGSIQQSEDGSFGFSRISTYVNTIRNQDAADDVVLLSAGDMFQGSALSNLTRGRAVIDVMNQVGFDAMTIGNHEFDWGIDTILQYNDNNLENGEADFPILNGNIMNKNTGDPVTFSNPYTVIEKENIRVGIIGLIGVGLESDIAAQNVKDYEFSSAIQAAGDYAEILRTEQSVDIVIALGHFDDYFTNQGITNLTGNRKVDAIINGHGHQNSYNHYTRSTGISVPVVEAGANAQRVGKIEILLDAQKNIIGTQSNTVYMDSQITPDAQVENLIAAAEEAVAPIMNRVYGVAGENLGSSSQVYDWAKEVIQKGMDVDVGITNSGGLRSGAFPIYTNDIIRYRNMVALMPFDNYLVYMKLSGSFLRSYSSSMQFIRPGLTIQNDDTLYKVGIVDYVADGNSVLFGSHNPEYTRTNILLMDLLAYDVYVASQNGQTWRPYSQGATLSSVCTYKN